MDWQLLRTETLRYFTGAVRTAAQQKERAFSRIIADFRGGNFQLFTCEADATGTLTRTDISNTVLVAGSPTQVTSLSLTACKIDGSWKLCSHEEYGASQDQNRTSNVLDHPEMADTFFKPIMRLLQPIGESRTASTLVILTDSSEHTAYLSTLLTRAQKLAPFQKPIFSSWNSIEIAPNQNLDGYAFFIRMADSMQSPGEYMIIHSHRAATCAVYDRNGFTYRPFDTSVSGNTNFRNYLLQAGNPTAQTDPLVVFCTTDPERSIVPVLGYIRWALAMNDHSQTSRNPRRTDYRVAAPAHDPTTAQQPRASAPPLSPRTKQKVNRHVTHRHRSRYHDDTARDRDRRQNRQNRGSDNEVH